MATTAAQTVATTAVTVAKTVATDTQGIEGEWGWSERITPTVTG